MSTRSAEAGGGGGGGGGSDEGAKSSARHHGHRRASAQSAPGDVLCPDHFSNAPLPPSPPDTFSSHRAAPMLAPQQECRRTERSHGRLIGPVDDYLAATSVRDGQNRGLSGC